jgi:hypothetical protein
MRYTLFTAWHIDAPVEKVWAAIYSPQHWPTWWKGAVRVTELETGDDLGVGGLHRYVWRSRLPYTLAFECRVTRVDPMVALEGTASGELEGRGRWRFYRAGSTSVVHYEWQVRTTRAWMRLLSPVARPLFKWNHDVLMREGGLGLSRFLGVRLISCTGNQGNSPSLRSLL